MEFIRNSKLFPIITVLCLLLTTLVYAAEVSASPSLVSSDGVYTAEAGGSHTADLSVPSGWTQIYWYLKSPSESDYGTSQSSVSDSTGNSTSASYTYSFPSGVSGDYVLTAYVYSSDGTIVQPSYTVSVSLPSSTDTTTSTETEASPISVGNILSGIKAAQVVKSQLDKDIIDLAKKVLATQNSILDFETQKSEMIAKRDGWWYIANEAYTDYWSYMTVDRSHPSYYTFSELADAAWQRYISAISSIRYFTHQIELIDYEISIYTNLYLNPLNEKLKKKREEFADLLKEIDRLNKLLLEQTP